MIRRPKLDKESKLMPGMKDAHTGVDALVVCLEKHDDTGSSSSLFMERKMNRLIAWLLDHAAGDGKL